MFNYIGGAFVNILKVGISRYRKFLPIKFFPSPNRKNTNICLVCVLKLELMNYTLCFIEKHTNFH